MRIQRIKLRLVNVPERTNWWSDEVFGQPAHQRKDRFIVEVYTDTGLKGLAEFNYGLSNSLILAELSDWLGENILDYNLRIPRERLTRPFEQIVLDLRGQMLGVPIWQLLGGRFRQWIPCTQCTGYKTIENTKKDAEWGWDIGFRSYKMKCITEAEHTTEARIDYVVSRVEAIHKSLPDMVVRPDIRWRLGEVWAVQELAKRLDGHKLDCLESPISKEAYGGSFSEWARLRQCISIPIADHVNGASDLIRRYTAQSLDYAIVGGTTVVETLDRSRLAHDLGLGGWSQTVAYGPGAAMGLHLAACMPNLTQPYDMVGPIAWQNDLTVETFEFENGSFKVPDRPGLGFTLNQDAVSAYTIEEKVLKL
jgi:L-alanine-DL-glutamate epimerase-like enolase superfamily enzyme